MFDENNKKDELSDEALKQMQLWCYEVFHLHPSGKLLMDKLKKYLEAPVMPLNANEAYGRMREGENRLIRLFIKLADDHINGGVKNG